MVTKAKLLIDCDPGHDDAVAILFAARHLDLVGITTVHGNNSLDNVTRNALALLELAGIDVLVAAGASAPLAQLQRDIADVHGPGGLDGADLPAPRRRPLETHAVDFIIEMARGHREELVLAAIGPQTNVALALAREPRLKQWIREITVMGGSTDRGNVTPAAEFNIHCDPEAAWAVFNSGIPIRMVGLNVTRRTGVSDDDIAKLMGSGATVGMTIGQLLTFYLARQRERRGVVSAPMHDVCAIIPYVAPDLLQAVPSHVAIELAGQHTRGMTVCDLPSALGTARTLSNPANALVAVEAESRKLIDLVIETLLSYP
ncbi:MAG: nucleoside hydrolase [Hyphomicrobiaceae bacterium]